MSKDLIEEILRSIGLEKLSDDKEQMKQEKQTNNIVNQ